MRNRPILTDVYDSVAAFKPEETSAYVFSNSGEERSRHAVQWSGRRLTLISVENADFFQAAINHTLLGSLTVPLRSEKALRSLWGNGRSPIYLDVTGLDHHVWAPLLKSALTSGRSVRVVYVEPADYALSSNPTDGIIFDLSERILGVRPIPGLACLADEEDDFCFVPLLGFEGARFSYLLEQVQPPGGRIVPVVGVPGFQPHFPFHAYLGNRLPLRDSFAWRNIRYAAANCPFSVFYLLEDIAAEFPLRPIKIAPIGTKPHAVGAVLFSLTRVRATELVYDHPIRKASRTSGTAKLLVYYVSPLLLDTSHG